MSRFLQQHHPTSFPKINLSIELMIQTWNHNIMWWYLFFPSKSMRHCPSCSIHQDFTTTITFSWTITQLHLSILCLLVYSHSSFIFCAYLFSIFLLVHSQLKFSIFCFAFHCQCLLHVLLLHCYVGYHWHILFVALCCASLGFQCQLFSWVCGISNNYHFR
jgi:hypothetical protein